ncbi:MAG: hypothetical protein AB7P17_13630 [Nitrospirales bacterium]|nr:hypothetical protein [Nitrospirales bacterium]
MQTHPKDEEFLKEEQIKKFKQKIGDLVEDDDLYTGSPEAIPFNAGDIRRVRATHMDTS